MADIAARDTIRNHLNTWAAREHFGMYYPLVLTDSPSIDVVTAAQAYSIFGGVLVGFALAGLFWYLTEHTKKQKEANEAGAAADAADERKLDVVVGTRHVTLTVFYAMASLVMTSFLYANLAGD